MNMWRSLGHVAEYFIKPFSPVFLDKAVAGAGRPPSLLVVAISSIAWSVSVDLDKGVAIAGRPPSLLHASTNISTLMAALCLRFGFGADGNSIVAVPNTPPGFSPQG